MHSFARRKSSQLKIANDIKSRPVKKKKTKKNSNSNWTEQNSKLFSFVDFRFERIWQIR